MLVRLKAPWFDSWLQASAAAEAEKALQARVVALESDLEAAASGRKRVEEELEAARAQSRERDAAMAQELADLQAQLTAANERAQQQVSHVLWLCLHCA